MFQLNRIFADVERSGSSLSQTGIQPRPIGFQSRLAGVGVTLAVLFFVSTGGGVPPAIADEPQSAVSAAMQTLFSPLSVPKRKTMGLLQRNFLDAAGQLGELEVAIVVDGTQSMSDELTGIRQSVSRMIGDLKRMRGRKVRVAIVIYRDTKSDSGEYEIPLKQFTEIEEEIRAGIERLQPESGAPYFHELMDIGIHAAIRELPWSENPAVSKWILLFGDAPPYEESYQDAKFPRAKRHFTDEVLVSLANREGIQIHCVLCDSTEATAKPHKESIAQTRRVMDRLAVQTGGMVLDLSYPVIREALAGKAKEPAINYTSIEPIETADLTQGGDGSDRPIRIAILPHARLENMTFDPSSESVRVATALYDKFRMMPGLRVKNPLEVEHAVKRVLADGVKDAGAIRALAGRMRVDYVMFGLVKPVAQVTSVAMRQRDGTPVVRVEFADSPDGLATKVLTEAAEASKTDAVLASIAQKILSSADRAYLESSLASTKATTTDLLTAIGSLEQALGLDIGGEESTRMLARAKAAATAAANAEANNPIANWLLANIAYNQASAAFRSGDAAEATESMKTCRSALRIAFNNRADIKSAALRTEIEADYLLIVGQQFSKAILAYESMTATTMPSDVQRRGHWMLSGLYAGDWGVPVDLTDRDASRKHVIEILKLWPDSPESGQLRQWLQWDEKAGRTRHHFLPQLNELL